RVDEPGGGDDRGGADRPQDTGGWRPAWTITRPALWGDLEAGCAPAEQAQGGGQVGRQPHQVEQDRQPGPLPAPAEQPQRELLQREGVREGGGEDAERSPN